MSQDKQTRITETLSRQHVQETRDVNISVRVGETLPRSVHAALLAEAKAEGVSLNQLCVSKLVAQLRAVV